MKKLIKSLIVLALLILFAETSTSQVTVAPVLITLDDQNRFGTYMVQNRSDSPQDVTVDFVFGYPSSDSLGNTYMVYDDSVRAGRYSAAPWVRAFPRVFTVAPGQQQTVRLTSRPPSDLDDGMYWARIKTSASARPDEADTLGSTTIGARIIFRFEQITTVMFRKGTVTTGIETGTHTISEADDTHHLLLTLQQTGNAPFLGTMEVVVSDANARNVFEHSEPVAIYFDVEKKIAIPSDILEPGSYKAQVRFKTSRADIPAASIVQAPTITDTFSFTVQ